jgi:hypothetical protein
VAYVTPSQNQLKACETNNNILPQKPIEINDDPPCYENYDFEEESVYQNMIVTEKRRMVPAPPSSFDPQVCMGIRFSSLTQGIPLGQRSLETWINLLADLYKLHPGKIDRFKTG